MSSEVFAMLLERRLRELSERAMLRNLSRSERAELDALKVHHDKPPAVAHRIRILAAKMAQGGRLETVFSRYSKRFKANLAEREALGQYGYSKAVWEIAYLKRKQATHKLIPVEETELQYLQLYHDSPEVLRLAQLKVKEAYGQLAIEEIRELTELHRNLYRHDGIPSHLLELFWPSASGPQKQEAI